MNIKQYIQKLPEEIQRKIYIYCLKLSWRNYVPLTAKIPSWYETKNVVEKIIFESKNRNIHFLHLPFNTLPENKEWIMGCQCSYCIKIKRNKKYSEFLQQYDNPYYFESSMPFSDCGINEDYNYDPLCGSIFEDPIKYALRTNKIQLDFG